MWKKRIVSLVITTILVFSTISFITIDKAEGSNGATHYVGGSGPYNFTTIQDAINYSENGDTIYVYSGSYYEYVTVNKSVNLIGEDRNNTILYDRFWITADRVNISGYKIINTRAGIVITSDKNMIFNNIIQDQPVCTYAILCYSDDNLIYNNYFLNVFNGTAIWDGSNNLIKNNHYENCSAFGVGIATSNNYICNNTFINNSHGIIVDASSNTITGNTITHSTNVGISIAGNDYHTITENTVTHNNRGIYLGGSSDHNIITNNTITYNTEYGIRLDKGPNYNTITGNTITNNNRGIYIQADSDYNTITENTIANNTYCIYNTGYDAGSNQTIYHNNFINNTNQAYDYYGTSFWDNGYPSGGNYWDDYDGWDVLHGPNQDIGGGDGISDTPYNITGGSNQDRYPLMHPYSPFSNVYFQGLEPLYTTEYIEIAVTITPKEAIAGAQSDFLFDPDMLSIEWVAEGEIFSEYDTYFDPGIIDNTNGTLKNVISLITTPNSSTTNQGSIAIISIRAKTVSGETTLNLSNVIVGRPDGSPIDVTIINTTVTIYHHDRWDVNWDDHVNILDLIIIGQWWGETGSPCWVSADVNCDGAINILDMIMVGQHWTG